MKKLFHSALEFIFILAIAAIWIPKPRRILFPLVPILVALAIGYTIAIRITP